jgi:hypothetical protein
VVFPLMNVSIRYKQKEVFFMPETQQEAEAVPLACLLTGEDLAARGEVVRPLMASYQKLQELEDGYAFQFPGESEWIQRVVMFIAEERSCCPFFTFELRMSQTWDQSGCACEGAQIYVRL